MTDCGCDGGSEDDVGDNGDGGYGGNDDGGGDGGVRSHMSLLPLLDGALVEPLPPVATLINPFECHK